jgi:hypothetical protein
MVIEGVRRLRCRRLLGHAGALHTTEREHPLSFTIREFTTPSVSTSPWLSNRNGPKERGSRVQHSLEKTGTGSRSTWAAAMAACIRVVHAPTSSAGVCSTGQQHACSLRAHMACAECSPPPQSPDYAAFAAFTALARSRLSLTRSSLALI